MLLDVTIPYYTENTFDKLDSRVRSRKLNHEAASDFAMIQSPVVWYFGILVGPTGSHLAPFFPDARGQPMI